MRIFIDTNILISAALNPFGTPQRAYNKALSLPNQGIISFQSLEEAFCTYQKKFPNKLPELLKFLSSSFYSLEIIQIPEEAFDAEILIRDIDDRTILRAAIIANADILLTGDKDFLESGITSPRIMTASEFLNL